MKNLGKVKETCCLQERVTAWFLLPRWRRVSIMRKVPFGKAEESRGKVRRIRLVKDIRLVRGIKPEEVRWKHEA